MQERQEVTNFTQGAKFFLGAVEKVLRFRVMINKISGNQGRAAALRELTAQQDIFTANKLAKIVANWQQLPLKEKVNYYKKAINLLNSIANLEHLALEKLKQLTAELDPRELPPFISIAVNAHTNLLEITSGLQAMTKSLNTYKPQEVNDISDNPINHTNNDLIDVKIEEKRRILVAKL